MVSYDDRVSTAQMAKRPPAIPNGLIEDLKLNLTHRKVSRGMELLDAHQDLITSFDPKQSNAAGLAAYVAQWVDVGYRGPTLLESMLCRFPKDVRSELPVRDYLLLRMAEGALALAQDRPDDARFNFDFVLAMREEVTDQITVSLAPYWIARCQRRKAQDANALEHA